jgi:hypothetical protein
MLIRPFFIAAAIAMPPLAAATPRHSCADTPLFSFSTPLLPRLFFSSRLFLFDAISFSRFADCYFSSRFYFAEPPPPLLPHYCHSDEFIDIAASADF